MHKRKFAILATTGVLAISLVVGGTTYAMFASSATNNGNKFTAGTLSVQAMRGDTPTTGPMFYTFDEQGSPGALPTGYWAPGDKQTRGLFLENTGSLDAKMKSLSITPVDVTSHEVISGNDQYSKDLAFAKNSSLIIWQLNAFDLDGSLEPWDNFKDGMDATALDKLMDTLNSGYQKWAKKQSGFDDPEAYLNQASLQNQLIDEMNEYLLENINAITNKEGQTVFTYNNTVKVTKLVSLDDMSQFFGKPVDVSSYGIQTSKNDSVLLGYTVEMNLNAPNTDASGVDLQNISAFFNFNSYWEQARHN